MTTPEMLDVKQIEAEIATRGVDDQVMIRCIRLSLLNILRAGGDNATLALALVGAQLAAGMEIL